MSALDDITKALARLPAPAAGRQRVIFVGLSARMSLDAIAKAEKRPSLNTRINGCIVRDTHEFPGWEIMDIDGAGRWHNVIPIAPTGRSG